nr:hypothetical protein [Tanacetum cinerariifolium]
EVVHKELGDRLVRAATTASSLEAEQDNGGGPRCQETIGDTIAQTRRVKKLEKKNRSRTHGLKRLYKVGLSTRVESSGDEESLDVLGGEEVFVAGLNQNVVEEVVNVAQVSTTATTITITTKEITLVSAADNEMFDINILGGEEDKGKGILIEPAKPIKRKDQIRLDEKAALKLQATFDEEEKLAKEKAEKLAERLQAQEQKELSDAEKATLFQQLLEKRRKQFVAKRAEEKRNKPPTKAQQRKIMCTYLKNIEGYKLKDLKLKEFDSI